MPLPQSGRLSDRLLTKNIFDLTAKLPGGSLIELFFDGGELFKQSLLFAGQPRRSDYGGDDEQVAASMTLQGDDAFAFEAEDRAGLRAFWNGEHFLSVECRHSDLRAQSGLCESDRHINVKIVALPLKQ